MYVVLMRNKTLLSLLLLYHVFSSVAWCTDLTHMYICILLICLKKRSGDSDHIISFQYFNVQQFNNYNTLMSNSFTQKNK